MIPQLNVKNKTTYLYRIHVVGFVVSVLVLKQDAPEVFKRFKAKYARFGATTKLLPIKLYTVTT